ncbi:tail fiber domain-containing protein [Winogradskyella helgolandensis]|uniref:tail fiber domain-containing protein n=1 Tax=Winogradskyella helgolandensis TaxID=2697010 RepID=UPI0015B7CC11|nr:tail fiber domain-containing protein [Winogradskyella helgolandensis]
MKTKITLLILFLTTLGFAQQGINYKAVIKDNVGDIVANDLIVVQFSILQGAAQANVYTETHSPTTDDNGIITLNIGEGTTISGTFSSIDWASDEHFLNVQINIGDGLTDMGTTQFKTVPYAKTANQAISASNIELPYYDETSESGAAFHVQNDYLNGRYGIAGSVGSGSETLPANNAGVMGQGTGAHGVLGVSKTSFLAGVQGVSESSEGVGVQGYGFGGGIGGHFYTTSNGVAALTTGNGNVGIGIGEPEMKMHVGGDLFIQTNLGELVMGFPNNGNQWQVSTRAQGADLQFQSKATSINSFTTQFRMLQNGEFQVGDISTPSAWLHVKNNSNINKEQLLLEEVGNDYARLGFTNTTSDAKWDIAGFPSNTTSSARLNFYFRNDTDAGDRMSLTGDGELGINGSPTARLELFQKSQLVGTGLRFDDGTANSDWDITHGFSLRFHYGGNLKSSISANTGAYTVSSDVSLKNNIENMKSTLDRVKQLRPTTYYYKDDSSKTKALGFIAQEVKPIFPEVVHFSEADQLYGIDYASFGVIAIKAIQEQQKVIEIQQQQIDELKMQVTHLLNKQ